MKEQDSSIKLFPTSVIGSLPRPQHVKDLLQLRLKNENQTASEEQLNIARTFAVQLQEQAGIDIVSDGEWTRLSYLGVIAELLHGFKREYKDGIYHHTVVDRLSWKQKGLFAKEAQFVCSVAKHKVKIAIPSPYLIASRMWNPEKSKHVYSTKKAFIDDLIPFLREEFKELVKINVSVIQLDDPNLCFFVDPEYRKKFADPETECQLAVDAINTIVEGIDLRSKEIAVHLCRSSGTRNKKIIGQSAKGFVAEGKYGFIIPFLKQLHVHQLAMEFAIPDADDLSVLKELPQNMKIGFGCVDCRPGIILTAEQIVKRVEEALKYLDKNRITLNPDCGFAPSSDAPTNLDEAYLKLKEMVKAAEILRNKYQHHL